MSLQSTPVPDLAAPNQGTSIQASPDQAPPSLAEAKAHVGRIVSASRSSFFWAMRLLPQDRREAMFAVYAFCREVDDIADRVGPLADKRRDLEAWRGEIEALYAGNPVNPVTVALLRAVRDYELPKDEFIAVIEGMTMDAQLDEQGETGEGTAALTTEDLLLYCRRVAGAVGMLSVHVFGDARPAALNLAVIQGEALQLTNILRDIAEDAERGRLYLPSELLTAQGLAGLPPDEVLRASRLREVCRPLAATARERFDLARSLIAQCDRRALRPARVMLEAYARILDRLIAADWADPTRRVSVPKLEKLWVALRYGLL